MAKSELTERVWLRISTNNKEKLNTQAKENKRNLSQEMDNILDQYFTK
jgi:hypothetical protein